MNAMEEKLAPFREKPADPEVLKKALREKLKRVPPTMEHVRDLVMDVRLLMRILSDEEFDLKEEARKDFSAALWYFIEDKDSLFDRLPIIGYRDDYKVVSYVKEKHREEIERYLSQVKHFLVNYF